MVRFAGLQKSAQNSQGSFAVVQNSVLPDNQDEEKAVQRSQQKASWIPTKYLPKAELIAQRVRNERRYAKDFRQTEYLQTKLNHKYGIKTTRPTKAPDYVVLTDPQF